MKGPVCTTLLERFPNIGQVAVEADAATGLTGHEWVLLRGIIGEGIIASGTNDREEVRVAIADPEPA